MWTVTTAVTTAVQHIYIDVVLLQRFAADAVILASLAHLDEGMGDTEEEMLTTVRRVVWGVLYVGDAGIASSSSEDVTKLVVEVFVEVREAVKLTVPEKKMEPACLRTRRMEA